MSNLPPGCSDSVIPGNRSEDVAWDSFFDRVMDSGLNADGARVRWDSQPDLVAALEGVVKEFSEWEGPEEDVTKGTRAPAEARNRSVRAYAAAQAALAKARKKE